MQRDIFHFLTVVVALAAFAVGCDRRGSDGHASRRDDGTIVVVTPADMPPYSYVDKATSEFKGVEIDILRAAAVKLGRKLEIRRNPFETLFGKLKSGEADVAASAITITDVRKEDMDFSVPYATGGASFLYRVGEPMPSMIRAETIKVAAVESMTHDFYLSLRGIDPIRFQTYAEAVAALVAGRVDTVFFDDGAVRHSAKTSNGKLAASRLEIREQFALAVRKGQPELKAAIDAAIVERTPAR